MKERRHTTDVLHDYALKGALIEVERILRLFPELRGRVTLADGVIGPSPERRRRRRRRDPHAHVRTHVLRHWKATQQSTTNGSSGKPGSLRRAVADALTATPQTSTQLAEAIVASGWVHKGASPLGTRVQQELQILTKHNLARVARRKGKRITWRTAGGRT